MSNIILVTFDKVEIKHLSDKVYALNIRNGEVAPQLVINVTDDQLRNCKYFSSREVRGKWLEARNEFIDYVLSYYGDGGIFSVFSPVVGRDEVMFACNAIDKVGLVDGYSGSHHIDEGDTFSRELVRDYLFLCRGKVDIEWDLVRVWFERNVEQRVVEHEFLING